MARAAERPGSAQHWQKHVYSLRGQSALRLRNRRDWQARERRTALYVTVVTVCSVRHQLPMFILSASVVCHTASGARDNLKGESGARLGRSLAIRVGRSALHVAASALSRDRHVRSPARSLRPT
jgi:hypothetical protein